MPTGTIKKLISHKGYGFLESDVRDDDIFFHVSKLDSSIDFDSLTEGEELAFEVSESDKGPEAINITRVASDELFEDEAEEEELFEDEEFEEEDTTEVLEDESTW